MDGLKCEDQHEVEDHAGKPGGDNGQGDACPEESTVLGWQDEMEKEKNGKGKSQNPKAKIRKENGSQIAERASEVKGQTVRSNERWCRTAPRG